MEQLEKCCVCLGPVTQPIYIWETDSDDIKWSRKLNLCVPEVIWCEEYVMCRPCTEQLQRCCAFRKLCMQSHKTRRQQWENSIQEPVKLDDLTVNVDDLLNIINVEEENDTACQAKETTTADIVPEEPTVADAQQENLHNGSKDDEMTNNCCEVAPRSEFSECKHCTAKFKSRINLALHNKNVHGISKPWDCLYCIWSFQTGLEVNEHEQMHMSVEQFNCDECGQKFYTLEAFKLHTKNCNDDISIIG